MHFHLHNERSLARSCALLACLSALFLPAPVAYAQQAASESAPSEEQCAVDDALLELDAVHMLADGEGPVEVEPWLRLLTAAEAETATVAPEQLTFPRAGNPWLACIDEGDLFWSVASTKFDYQFARRVKDIARGSDEVTFYTAEAGLGDIASGLRTAPQQAHPAVALLNDQLPKTTSTGLQRSSVSQEGDDEMSLVYRDGATRVNLVLQPKSKAELRRAREAAEKRGAERVTLGGHPVYQSAQESFTVFQAPIRAVLISGAIQSEEAQQQDRHLAAVLEALDVDALDALTTSAEAATD